MAAETAIEQDYVDYVEDLGYECLKLNLRGNRGWPDRLTPLDAGRSLFIEFKRPGEDPDGLQWHRIDYLRRRGHAVYVCESSERAIEIFESERAVYSQGLYH